MALALIRQASHRSTDKSRPDWLSPKDRLSCLKTPTKQFSVGMPGKFGGNKGVVNLSHY